MPKNPRSKFYLKVVCYTIPIIYILYIVANSGDIFEILTFKDSENLKLDSHFDKEYKQLFNEDIIRDFTSVKSFRPRHRNSFVELCYKNTYNVIVFKIKQVTPVNFKMPALDTVHSDVSMSHNIAYRRDFEENISMHYAYHPRDPTGQFKIRANFDFFTSKDLNDSTVWYRFNLHSAAFFFEGDDKYDMVMEANPERLVPEIPTVEILFMVRNRTLYCLILSSKRSNQNMVQMMLPNLIKGHFTNLADSVGR